MLKTSMQGGGMSQKPHFVAQASRIGSPLMFHPKAKQCVALFLFEMGGEGFRLPDY